MPKNPHPPRSGKKKAPLPPNDGLDIVFSNAKGDAKKGKNGASISTASESSAGKGKSKDAIESMADDAPKKPDTRALIGGASWTGKLPLTMFNEHCQKQKWEKPEYTMNKIPSGFISAVILRAINPKTREKEVFPIRFPKEHQSGVAEETPVEARHFAAAYALFRVSSMKNLHMMLPPKYKELWKGFFQDLKNEDEKGGKEWLYSADPFRTARDREEAIAAAIKRREEREKQLAIERAQPGGSGGQKGWTRAPKIDMGKRTRIEVERLIRQHSIWNPHASCLHPSKRDKIIDDIVKLGFRKSHVEEAAELCKDKEEILEWLLIHVPEDDLPGWSLPENYTADVSLASQDLKREAAIKRLATSGYSMDLCEEAMDTNGGNEARAAAFLQERLRQNTDEVSEATIAVRNTCLDSFTDGDEVDVWENETAVLASIYGDRLCTNSDSSFTIVINPEGHKDPITLSARKPFGPYPHIPPIISIQAALPAYIRLAILQKTLQCAQVNFLGEQMVFNLVDWIEHNVAGIIQNPGRLSDVSAAASAGETFVAKSPKQGRNRNRVRKCVKWNVGTPGSIRIHEQWKATQDTPAQQRMLAIRRALPAWKLKDSIVAAVNTHQVIIISGETGSGKSTQAVQFILDDLIERNLGESVNIICTQPRRISALGLADRVSEERCGKVGEEIGYIIRGESRVRDNVTKITFVTTGILLRRLQTSGGQPEDVVAALSDVSHVVVDEVHERSLDTDFLLILLRDVMGVRKDLKVILMSATLDADVFAQYFSNVGPVARIEIEGRTHPVRDYYLDDVIRITGFNGHTEEENVENANTQKQLVNSLRDIGTKINYDFIAQVVRQIDYELGRQDGGILIFLPGTMEIDRTLRALQSIPKIHALPLHASLLPAEQRRVFQTAPKGYRKVIASTNVAETSITIEDIVAVIDSGKVKETTFDPENNMVRLEEILASKAACKQRRGRAGRVRAGTCYKLFTRNTEYRMLERPEPEICRVPLEQLCLSVKAMGVKDVSHFLASALTPPDTRAVDGAMKLLRQMGVLDVEELTALGRHVAMIPADLRCGKLLVYGAIFGCLEACLTISAILTVRSPFVAPQTKRDEAKAARSSFGLGHGDLICDLRAYEQFSVLQSKSTSYRDIRYWCEQNCISQNGMNDISSNRSQYLSSLKEIGFLPLRYNPNHPSPSDRLNVNNNNSALLRALIAGSFNPQISRIEFPSKKFAATSAGAMELDPEAKTIKYFNQAVEGERNDRVFMHPSSTMFDIERFPSGSQFMAYFEKVATSKVFIRNVTPVNAYAMLMFGGPIELDTHGRGLTVDGWVRLRGWARIGVLVGRLRGMLDDILDRKADEPNADVGGDEVVDIVRRLVELDGLDR